jgi:hypothetical protein
MMDKIKLTLDNLNDVAYGDTIICGEYGYTAEWHKWGGLAVDGIPLHIFLAGVEDCWLVVQ